MKMANEDELVWKGKIKELCNDLDTVSMQVRVQGCDLRGRVDGDELDGTEEEIVEVLRSEVERFDEIVAELEELVLEQGPPDG
ncbi:MAG: hypothetical protein ABEL76_05690 [Bradymonadaceae bacterium]